MPRSRLFGAVVAVVFITSAFAQNAVNVAPSPLLQVDRNRASIVDGIVANWQEALLAKYGTSAGSAQAELRASLMALRADRLLAASLAGSYATLDALIADGRSDAAAVSKVAAKNLGDANADLTYTPVNPCRIVDTRNAGGPLIANVARTFAGYNASSFAAQGGTASNCGMPNGVAAIAMNVYAVNPTNLGFIKVWASNASEPAVSTVNYQSGITAIATGAIVPVDAANNNGFSAKSPSAVDFIADVVGYFRAPGGQYFTQGGNAFGTAAVLGTTDNQFLELRVNGQRGLRIEPNAISPRMLGGYAGNGAYPSVAGATVAGGGAPGAQSATLDGFSCLLQYGCLNSILDDYGTVGGGAGNAAGAGTAGVLGSFATVGGGVSNWAYKFGSTVSGGRYNAASGAGSTVIGGALNIAAGDASVAGGANNNASGTSAVALGFNNAPSGTFSIALGDTNQTSNFSSAAIGHQNNASGSSSMALGSDNVASGDYAVALGSSNEASANNSLAMGTSAAAHAQGMFVWSDLGSSPQVFDPTAPPGWANAANTFNVRARGGVWFATGVSADGLVYWGCTITTGGGLFCTSDRRQKRNFELLDGTRVLEKLATLPIYQWQPKDGPNVNAIHYGPTAQDFYATFGLGHTDLMIGQQDADGVAMAAIQGLNTKVEILAAQVAQKDREIAVLRDQLSVLESIEHDVGGIKEILAERFDARTVRTMNKTTERLPEDKARYE